MPKTYTKKQLKQLVSDGKAVDLTNATTAEVNSLRPFDHIGTCRATIGATGGLWKSNKNGKYYVLLARCANLLLM